MPDSAGRLTKEAEYITGLSLIQRALFVARLFSFVGSNSNLQHDRCSEPRFAGSPYTRFLESSRSVVIILW